MAMIKCPKCHHHISSMAQTCPECGATINTEEARGEVCQEVEADSTSSVEAADEKKLTAPRREDKRGGLNMEYTYFSNFQYLIDH